MSGVKLSPEIAEFMIDSGCQKKYTIEIQCFENGEYSYNMYGKDFNTIDLLGHIELIKKAIIDSDGKNELVID